jgi:sigma-B regulation protein RsbU (phosphoserine phosphatase)
MFRFVRDRFRPTLALKLGFLVLTSTGVIFFLAFGYSNHVARGLMLRAVEENTRNLARSTASRIEAVLHAVEPLPQWLARHVAGERLSEPEISRLLQDELRASPHIYGSAVAFAPGEFSNEAKLAAPYVYRKDGRLQYVNLADGNYDYVSQDWYLIPRETRQAIWTDPYFDEGGGEAMMCSYCVPFFREADGQSTFAGVATADVQLEHMVQIVSSIKLYQSGYAFLLSQNGQIISHPNQDYVFKESIFSLADESGDKQWREIGRKMLRGGEGFVRVRSLNTGLASWLYYAPVSSGWSVGVLFPEDEILAGLSALKRVVFWIGLVGFGILLAVITALSRGITRPIRTLAQKTREIARGNLDLAVPPAKSRDEVGDLSLSFENMRLALKEYVANLATATAAKERIESELKIARTIQRSFLPKRFPPFPDHTEFDIYAELQAAKEVGGDLYDFFLLDDHRLFFSIGDVSGKGVPAALFMAVTKTLMKGVAEQYLLPSQVLAKVNHELYVDNEQMMFVTLFCGVLDLQTGELRYTNAGHLPPLLLRGAQGVSWMDLPKGTVLGIWEATDYETRTVRLEPMDTLLLYTDGVNEAMNARKELFGDDRLRAFADSQAGTAPKELVEGLFGSVHSFAGGEEQSDDITVLALQYHGRR